MEEVWLPCSLRQVALGITEASACRKGGVAACDAYVYPVLICLIVTGNAWAHVPKLSRSSAGFAYTLQLSQILYLQGNFLKIISRIRLNNICK